jgi:hypothetical protein
MDTLDDAIETLILNQDESVDHFYNDINKEIDKYKTKK